MSGDKRTGSAQISSLKTTQLHGSKPSVEPPHPAIVASKPEIASNSSHKPGVPAAITSATSSTATEVPDAAIDTLLQRTKNLRLPDIGNSLTSSLSPSIDNVVESSAGQDTDTETPDAIKRRPTGSEAGNAKFSSCSGFTGQITSQDVIETKAPVCHFLKIVDIPSREFWSDYYPMLKQAQKESKISGIRHVCGNADAFTVYLWIDHSANVSNILKDLDRITSVAQVSFSNLIEYRSVKQFEGPFDDESKLLQDAQVKILAQPFGQHESVVPEDMQDLVRQTLTAFGPLRYLEQIFTSFSQVLQFRAEFFSMIDAGDVLKEMKQTCPDLSVTNWRLVAKPLSTSVHVPGIENRQNEVPHRNDEQSPVRTPALKGYRSPPFFPPSTEISSPFPVSVSNSSIWPIGNLQPAGYPSQSEFGDSTANPLQVQQAWTSPSWEVVSPTGRTRWWLDHRGNPIDSPSDGLSRTRSWLDSPYGPTTPSSNGRSSGNLSSRKEIGNQTIHIASIDRGEDVRTTIMLRNIPNKLKRADIENILNATSRGRYDFLYLRFDFQRKANVGYGFVNFISASDVAIFYRRYNDQAWPDCPWRTVHISYATIQGLDCLVEKFRNSAIMEEDPSYRPQLYHTIQDTSRSPAIVGSPKPFPDPNNATKKKRSQDNAAYLGLFAPQNNHQLRNQGRRSQFDRGTPAQLHEERLQNSNVSSYGASEFDAGDINAEHLRRKAYVGTNILAYPPPFYNGPSPMLFHHHPPPLMPMLGITGNVNHNTSMIHNQMPMLPGIQPGDTGVGIHTPGSNMDHQKYKN